MSTAGYAAVAAGEDWHYVGEAGEPAFNDGWSNFGSPWPALSFRLREAGIVDVVGVVTTDGTSTVVTTLPSAYSPLNARRVPLPFTRDRSGTLSARMGQVDQSAVMTAFGADTSGDVVYITESYFIGNADAP